MGSINIFWESKADINWDLTKKPNPMTMIRQGTAGPPVDQSWHIPAHTLSPIRFATQWSYSDSSPILPKISVTLFAQISINEDNEVWDSMSCWRYAS